MRKVFAITLAVAGLAILGLMGCTDAGDPVFPKDHVPIDPDAPVPVDFIVSDLVGGWDNLQVDGELTGGVPQAMTQDGIMWQTTIEVERDATFTYGIYTEDGTKALVPVMEGLSVTVSETGQVSGDTETELTPAAGTGFRMVVTNGNPAFTNIKIKGAMNDWTAGITGSSADGVTWYLDVAGDLAEGSYEWGVIEDDGSEWGIWLLPAGEPNLMFTVDAEGVPSGELTFDIESPTPSIDVTFAVDMNGETVSFDGVHLTGSFGTDGYVEWQPAAISCTDDDVDGVYEVTLTLRQAVSYQFKFINGATWDDSEVVPGECGVEDGVVAGVFNRIYETPASATDTYSTAFGGCPAGK